MGVKPIISQKILDGHFQANLLFFFKFGCQCPSSHNFPCWFFSAMAGTLDDGFHGFRGGLRRKWYRCSGQGNPQKGGGVGLVSMKEMVGFKVAWMLVEGELFVDFVTW